MYAFASLVLGYCVDHLNWPRTWVLVAANVLLAGMYVLEVSICMISVNPGPHKQGRLYGTFLCM